MRLHIALMLLIVSGCPKASSPEPAGQAQPPPEEATPALEPPAPPSPEAAVPAGLEPAVLVPLERSAASLIEGCDGGVLDDCVLLLVGTASWLHNNRGPGDERPSADTQVTREAYRWAAVRTAHLTDRPRVLFSPEGACSHFQACEAEPAPEPALHRMLLHLDDAYVIGPDGEFVIARGPIYGVVGIAGDEIAVFRPFPNHHSSNLLAADGSWAVVSFDEPRRRVVTRSAPEEVWELPEGFSPFGYTGAGLVGEVDRGGPSAHLLYPDAGWRRSARSVIGRASLPFRAWCCHCRDGVRAHRVSAAQLRAGGDPRRFEGGPDHLRDARRPCWHQAAGGAGLPSSRDLGKDTERCDAGCRGQRTGADSACGMSGSRRWACAMPFRRALVSRGSSGGPVRPARPAYSEPGVDGGPGALSVRSRGDSTRRVVRPEAPTFGLRGPAGRALGVGRSVPEPLHLLAGRGIG